jgi:hypothetical protein
MTLRFTLFDPGTGFDSRTVDLPVSFEMHAAPRTPGDPVQSFNTDIFRLFGQLPPGDPDLALVRITAGTDFGLPSPGHTTLTQAGGDWAVDSFFDISLRIDFVGDPNGPFSGLNVTVADTVRFRTGGGCVHLPVDCDDADACTTDSCDPNTGACQNAPVNCDDGDPCTGDSCNPGTGLCMNVPLSCDDGDSCTEDDRCVQTPSGGTSCQGDPVTCDDGNPCTADFCDPETGQCRSAPMPDAPCDDADACTLDDHCVLDALGDVACQGTPAICDDLNPCTVDSCDPGTGQCVAVPVDCDDADPCIDDACSPTTGQCVHDPADCDDGNACTLDSCQREACVVPDNGEGSADLPPQGCAYTGEEDLQILDGLPAGSSIDIAAVLRSFACTAAPAVCSFAPPVPGSDCDQAGGSLGGEESCADSTLAMQMTGTGALAGFSRSIDLPSSLEIHAAPRVANDPVQSFNTVLFRFLGQIGGDPDFDLLRITAGTDFSLPGPGQTTLTRQATGDWSVDSFFDVTYRIDYIGRPGGMLTGRSGSTTGIARFRTGGGCVHLPADCDDGDACTTDSCDPTNGACQNAP